MTDSLEQDLPALLAELSVLAIKIGADDKARLWLEAIAELEPEHATTHLLYGMYYFSRQDFKAAEEHYRKGLDKAPNDDLSRAFLAESLIPQKRYREAGELLDKVLSTGSNPDAVEFAKHLNEGLQQGYFQQYAGS
jgi:Tfp pilus assembly protein PilF